MSEELNRHKAELNDAALEGVSGGISAYDRAKDVCTFCYAGTARCTGVFIASLCVYLEENGADSVTSYEQCPYYKF